MVCVDGVSELTSTQLVYLNPPKQESERKTDAAPKVDEGQAVAER